MDRMGRPADIHPVEKAVFPVVNQIGEHNADQHRDPINLDVENRKLPDIVKGSDIKRAQNQKRNADEKPERDIIGERIANEGPAQFPEEPVAEKFKGQEPKGEYKEPVIYESLQLVEPVGTERCKNGFQERTPKLSRLTINWFALN